MRWIALSIFALGCSTSPSGPAAPDHGYQLQTPQYSLNAGEATKITPAGIFAFGSNSFHLPAGGTGIQVTSGCNVPKQMNVFAVQPHMHYLGSKIEFDSGADESSAQMVYQRDPWQFGAQP